MEITSDVILKGNNWRLALKKFDKILPNYLQPIYSLYAVCISIGIMYDKQLDIGGVDMEDDTPLNVPRTVLHPHNSDLDFMFQTAILTSKNVDFTDDERIKLAFDPSCDIQFNKFEFLTKFAHYGVGKLLENTGDDPLETMETLKQFLASSMEGYNYDINSISDEELDVEDLK